MNRSATIIVVVLLQSSVAAAQDPSITLDLINTLTNEASEHRQYLENLYDRTFGLMTAVIAFLAVCMGFLGWKTLRDVRNSAVIAFDKEIKVRLDEHAKHLDSSVEQIRISLESAEKDLRVKILMMEDAVAKQRDASDALFQVGATVDDPTRPPRKGRGFGKKVLWVDDYPQNNAGVAEVLKRLGVTIVTALDTYEAMDQLQSDVFDLVISDMGRGSDSDAGLTLLREMHSLGNSTPFIVYASGKAVARTRSELISLGALDAVTGPTLLMNRVKPLLFPDAN